MVIIPFKNFKMSSLTHFLFHIVYSSILFLFDVSVWFNEKNGTEMCHFDTPIPLFEEKF